MRNRAILTDGKSDLIAATCSLGYYIGALPYGSKQNALI